jgi:putative hemolysin
MTIFILLELIVLLVLLFLSAFFSGSETALFALPRHAVERLKNSHPGRGSMISGLLSNPRRLLISIVVGNMLVNIFSSTLAERFSAQIFSRGSLAPFSWVFSTLVMTFLILILGEIVPKTLAINRAEKFSLRVAPAIVAVQTAVLPFRKVVRFVSDRIVAVLERKKPGTEAPLTKDELATAIRVGSREGTLNGDEREMITEIFKLGDKSVRQLMTPRNEIVSFEVDTPLTDLATVIKGKEYSRIPIFSGKPENVIGILYPKDLIVARAEGIEEIELVRFLRTPYFVPETMKAARLLKEFLKRKIHIALVVDEYGGLSGLITLDDLIEEIVGEIRERGEIPLEYEIVDPDTIRVRGRMELDDANEQFDLELFSEGNVTLGGYLSERLGHLPQPGEVYEEPTAQFEVINLKGNRIGQVLLKKAGLGNRLRREEKT